ncbi:TPA: hypothetical protein HA246_04800 [Candidatus Woesearchaeota archaeon]|nr:hypothetical protein [Candidatus Woesearchaeota archaeon]
MLTTEQEQIVQRIKDIGKVSTGIAAGSSKGLPRKGLGICYVEGQTYYAFKQEMVAEAKKYLTTDKEIPRAIGEFLIKEARDEGCEKAENLTSNVTATGLELLVESSASTDDISSIMLAGLKRDSIPNQIIRRYHTAIRPIIPKLMYRNPALYSSVMDACTRAITPDLLLKVLNDEGKPATTVESIRIKLDNGELEREIRQSMPNRFFRRKKAIEHITAEIGRYQQQFAMFLSPSYEHYPHITSILDAFEEYLGAGLFAEKGYNDVRTTVQDTIHTRIQAYDKIRKDLDVLKEKLIAGK